MSKIDWNLKYAFPKTAIDSESVQTFEYKAKSSKIDLLNKNLEKKITQLNEDFDDNLFKLYSFKNKAMKYNNH
jgi:hypothetical protein